MWFNGACVGLQASEHVLVFWASVQMLYNQSFQMKTSVNSWAFKSSSWLYPSCLNCSPLPDSPITSHGRKMGSSSRWAFSPAGFQTQEQHFISRPCPWEPELPPEQVFPTHREQAPWRLWWKHQNNVWPCPKSGHCSHHPRAGHHKGSWGRFCSALGTPPINMDWDVFRDLSLNVNFLCPSKFSPCSPAIPPPRGWCNAQRWKGACIQMKPGHWGMKSRSYGKNMCLWRLPLTLAHTFCQL